MHTLPELRWWGNMPCMAAVIWAGTVVVKPTTTLVYTHRPFTHGFAKHHQMFQWMHVTPTLT